MTTKPTKVVNGETVELSDAEIFERESWLQVAVAKQVELDAVAYKDKRAAEYPPMTDYLDGIVKGNQAQIQTYIDACLAVKAKYPKPTV
jgi:hypothetical protein